MSTSPLRKFSTDQLEQAIAKALKELSGCDFIVEISGHKYVASRMNALTGKAERVEFALAATQKPEPFDININFVDPDGNTKGTKTIHVDNQP
ncbi:hypothetical protein OI25_596 [Paraburkholderia fungorum]|uniref:Uncharacterized protein n=1 Tax=Paraburkholderia fungorum TaxID=134537 RepID=A0AAU8THP2_9BURK|nr:hypothetical protein [Paraburkholderia fungorum]AJZ60175.1 hypothetical protein OI25_596 [Paraburkholderia fungorum]